jgi:uncharacterized membrane protein YedE/YeeE
MEHFTPIQSLLGGVLIGLSAAGVLLMQGRVAGVSGMCGAVLRPRGGDVGWRVSFLAGLIAVGALGSQLYPASFAVVGTPSLGAVAVAGLLVGFGTRLGNGCTSGHGVCGISRLSMRSLVATLTFMFTGGVSVFVWRHLLGGSV